MSALYKRSEGGWALSARLRAPRATCGGSNPLKLVRLLLPPRRPDRALPLADFPQLPRDPGVPCLGARRDLLLIEKVCTTHIRDVWRGGKPHKGFCAFSGLRDAGLTIVIPKFI